MTVAALMEKSGETNIEALIPPRRLVDFLWWTEQNLKTEKGQPYEFEDRAYLKDIYDCQAPRMVIKKSAQMGVSAYAINRALWLCDNQIRTVIFTMPTAGDVSNFSQTRINPSLRKSNLKSIMNVDNVGIKQIGDSFIYRRDARAKARHIYSNPTEIRDKRFICRNR